jgi:hypothetical protein
MKRLQRVALLIALAGKVQERGGWCGEAHMQKAVYFLQELFSVPMGFDFILYKNSPFSFDLRDELTAMRADGILRIRQNPEYYGPSLEPTEVGIELKRLYPKTLDQYESQLRFVVEHLGARDATLIELLAAALYVAQQEHVLDDPEAWVQRVRKLKPHAGVDEAKSAVGIVAEMIRQAKALIDPEHHRQAISA